MPILAIGTQIDIKNNDAIQGGDHEATNAFLKKLQVVSLLLEQSPAVLQIACSGVADAGKELDDARIAYRHAIEEAKAGRADNASNALDDAFRRVVSARYMVPDDVPAGIRK